MSKHHDKLRGGQVPADIRRRVFERDKWTCQHCGRIRAALECHHIERLSEGGMNQPDNLMTLCRDCHIQHHQKERANADPLYANRLEWSKSNRSL